MGAGLAITGFRITDKRFGLSLRGLYSLTHLTKLLRFRDVSDVAWLYVMRLMGRASRTRCEFFLLINWGFLDY